MKIKQPFISTFLSVRSITSVICSLVLSLFLFVGQASAAEGNKIATESTLGLVDADTLSTGSVTKVSINRADAGLLAQRLKGIGLKKAQAIVDWRSANGDFIDLDQLLDVKGIGEKTLQLNRERLTL